MTKTALAQYPPPGWWTANRLPVPEYEYRFHHVRRWRFDYYFKDAMVAIEIEGGIYKYGRHNRASSFWDDAEKYNAAAEMGIRLLRYPSVNKMDLMQIGRAIPIALNRPQSH
jgi:hypothetical protein